jgi:hypothetical protein
MIWFSPGFELSLFFPLEIITPDVHIRDYPQLTVGAVIPAAPMGGLFDDVARFSTKPAGDQNLSYSYVHIEQVNGRIKVIKEGNLKGTSDANEDRIYRHLEARRGSESDADTEKWQDGPDEIQDVRIDSVDWAFLRISDEEVLDWTVGGLTTHAWTDVVQFLTAFFGPLPRYRSNFVSRLAEAGSDVGDRDKYWSVLRIACEEVKRTLERP